MVSAVNPQVDVQGFNSDTVNVTDFNNSTLRYFTIYENPKLHAGEYSLDVIEKGGCKIRVPVLVPLDTNFDPNSVPNVFTPNDDGANDTFYIRNLPADSKVSITNRWGVEVYSSSNYQNDWNASNIQDGVYYYRVSAADKVVTGWVEIIRGK
jgi:large repetitive protein